MISRHRPGRSGPARISLRSEGLANEVRGHLDGRGADVVLDPQGTRWLEDDVAMLASAGRIVFFGNAGGAALGQLEVPSSTGRTPQSEGSAWQICLPTTPNEFAPRCHACSTSRRAPLPATTSSSTDSTWQYTRNNDSRTAPARANKSCTYPDE